MFSAISIEMYSSSSECCSFKKKNSTGWNLEVAEIRGLQQKVTDFIKLQRERFMNGSAISVASIRSAWHGVAGAVGLDHDPSNSATRQLSKTKKKADSFIRGGAIEPE